MEVNQNCILQTSDSVTGRRCAVRIDPGETDLPLDELLACYLKSPRLDRLMDEKRITADSAETLASLQDLVYLSADSGLLGDVFAGVEFNQGQRTLMGGDKLVYEPVQLHDRSVLLAELTVDRTNVGYDRNWVGFNRRRWDRHANAYSAFVESCLEQRFGQEAAQSALQLESAEHGLMLVEAVAKRIWDSDFESYSRFTGRKLVYKTGDETLLSVIEGSGGICSEKVQSLKFVTDRYGLDSEIVLAGAEARAPVPESRLREMLTTFDFKYSRRYMRYWQHLALLYHSNGTDVLVDATNGNIPFLFLKNGQAEPMLAADPKPVRVKMAVRPEDFYYHRVAQDIPMDLLFAMEGWIPHMDLVQVFDNELGLHITSDFMVTPIVFRTGEAFDKLRREYERVCARAGLECEVSREWGFDTALGGRYAEQHPVAARKVLASKDHLLARYDDCHGPGHDAGLVVIGLRR